MHKSNFFKEAVAYSLGRVKNRVRCSLNFNSRYGGGSKKEIKCKMWSKQLIWHMNISICRTSNISGHHETTEACLGHAWWWVCIWEDLSWVRVSMICICVAEQVHCMSLFNIIWKNISYWNRISLSPCLFLSKRIKTWF